MAENVKTILGLALGSVKTIQGVDTADYKTIFGVDNTGGGGSETAWVTGFAGIVPRNDFTGDVGGKFTVGGSNVTVSSLGRFKLTGNSGTHTVGIYLMDGTAVVTASVDVSGGTNNTYVYVSVSPTVLSASTQYVLASSETNGGDTWTDDTGNTPSTTAVATFDGGVFRASGAFSDSSAGIVYGPPDFKYTSP